MGSVPDSSQPTITSIPADIAVERGLQFGERLALPPKLRAVLGSGGDADVVLHGAGVAPAHCAILRDEARGFVLQDLGAPEGTRVNGRRVGELALADGDRITCGDVDFRFHSVAAAEVERTSAAVDAGPAPAAEIVEERPAQSLLLGGAKAMAGFTYLVAIPCASARRSDHASQEVLDACQLVLGARRGAVLTVPEGSPPIIRSVRRDRRDPSKLELDVPRDWLGRVASERVAILGRHGKRRLALAPLGTDGRVDVLYLEWDTEKQIRGNTDDLLPRVAVVGALLGFTLKRLTGSVVEDAFALERLLVQSADDMLFALDDEGRFTLCNHLPGRQGFGRDSVVGRRLVDLVEVGDRNEVLEALDDVLRDGTEVLLETGLQTPGGQHILSRLQLGPLHNANGAVIGIRGVGRDVGELRAAQQAAAEAAGEQPRGAEALLGDSDAMRTVRQQVEQAQGHAYPVLVCGETGTGKELIARAIYLGSGRAAGPFLTVNCAALPDPLLEAELFGSARGSYARRGRQGLIAAAEGGVLFLDEIGELSLAMQGRLLQVLEAEPAAPGGAAGPTDVRIVAATHRNLTALAEQDAFRRDLLYRLDVMRINLPPLRERLDDLPVLVRHGLHRVREELGTAFTIDDEALATLAKYHWPGNVRELFNVLRRAAVAARDGTITKADLGAGVLRPPPAPVSPMGSLRPDEAAERDAILKAIAEAGGNRKKAAANLGIPRATFYRRLKQYGVL